MIMAHQSGRTRGYRRSQGCQSHVLFAETRIHRQRRLQPELSAPSRAAPSRAGPRASWYRTSAGPGAWTKSRPWGVAIYGNGGMNTDYAAGDTVLPTPAGPMPVGTFGGGDAGVDYAQLFINATYARRVSDSVSLGIAGIVNYSQFKVEGISGFRRVLGRPDPAVQQRQGRLVRLRRTGLGPRRFQSEFRRVAVLPEQDQQRVRRLCRPVPQRR